MAYDDIYKIHYVTSYGRENASYSLTTGHEGNGTIDVDPEKDSYDLDEDVSFSADPDSNSLLGYWEFANREDIKVEPNFTMNMLNDTDITAVFGDKLFTDYFDRSSLADTDDWSLYNHKDDSPEEMSIENGELEMRITDTDTNEDSCWIYNNNNFKLF